MPGTFDNAPWINGVEALPICGFFLLWNSIMAFMMITAVFAPLSNGICQAQSVILLLFPHWYIGIIMPAIIGGIIPAAVTFILPYSVATCIGFSKTIWGCQYGNKEANHEELEAAVDKEGNKIQIGDLVENSYRVSGGKHRASYMDTREIILKSMSHNGTWKGQPGKDRYKFMRMPTNSAAEAKW